MPILKSRKIKLKRPVTFKKAKPKIALDLKNIDKTFLPINKKISTPLELSNVFNSIKRNFNLYVSPYLTGEYKKIKLQKKEIVNDTKKVIIFRFQLIKVTDVLKNYIQKFKEHLLIKFNKKDEYVSLEKEIKKWEGVLNKILKDIIENVTFIIKNNLVPICEKYGKELKGSEM